MPVVNATPARTQRPLRSAAESRATSDIPVSSTQRDDEEDDALRHPVGHDARHEGRQQHPDGARRGDEGQGGGAAPEADDLPHERDDPDPLANEVDVSATASQR